MKPTSEALKERLRLGTSTFNSISSSSEALKERLKLGISTNETSDKVSIINDSYAHLNSLFFSNPKTNNSKSSVSSSSTINSNKAEVSSASSSNDSNMIPVITFDNHSGQFNLTGTTDFDNLSREIQDEADKQEQMNTEQMTEDELMFDEAQVQMNIDEQICGSEEIIPTDEDLELQKNLDRRLLQLNVNRQHTIDLDREEETKQNLQDAADLQNDEYSFYIDNDTLSIKSQKSYVSNLSSFSTTSNWKKRSSDEELKWEAFSKSWTDITSPCKCGNNCASRLNIGQVSNQKFLFIFD